MQTRQKIRAILHTEVNDILKLDYAWGLAYICMPMEAPLGIYDSYHCTIIFAVEKNSVGSYYDECH